MTLQCMHCNQLQTCQMEFVIFLIYLMLNTLFKHLESKSTWWLSSPLLNNSDNKHMFGLVTNDLRQEEWRFIKKIILADNEGGTQKLDVNVC